MNLTAPAKHKGLTVVLALTMTFGGFFVFTMTTSAAPVQSGGTAAQALAQTQTPTATTSPTASASPTTTPTPAQTVTITATPGSPQCSDQVDNDGDGRIDHPNDPGCQNRNDTTESPDPTGTTPSPGTTTTVTPTPGATQCSDRVDNDGDGRIDHPNDAGCESPNDNSESPDPGAPQCSDGIDNDNDGRIDHPNDPGCAGAQDNDERNEAGGGGGGGGGRDVFVGSSTSIRHRFAPRHAFKGQVAAGRARCESGRRVVLRKAGPGRDLVVGRDRTNRRGKWRIAHDVGAAGRYYAVAKRKSFAGARGRTIICRSDRSRTIGVRG